MEKLSSIRSIAGLTKYTGQLYHCGLPDAQRLNTLYVGTSHLLRIP